MVRQGLDAVDDQQLGQLLHTLARQTIDNAALAGTVLDEADNLLVQLHGVARLGAHLVVEVRPVEARDEGLCILHAQVLDDVLLHLGRGRGRQGEDGHLGVDGLDGVAQTTVLGTEVVAPLRDAVRLVDGEERDGDLLQEFHRLLLRQCLRGHVEQLRVALQQVLFHLGHLGAVERRVEEVGHTLAPRGVAHGVHLVLHQRYQRRHHNGYALADHGGQLVAQALAAARGHDDKGVVAVQKALDNGFLVALELVESEYFFQICMQILHLFTIFDAKKRYGFQFYKGSQKN